jgi:hypothetical protein
LSCRTRPPANNSSLYTEPMITYKETKDHPFSKREEETQNTHTHTHTQQSISSKRASFANVPNPHKPNSQNKRWQLYTSQ